MKDGVTVTELTPSNEKLIQRGQTMLPPPEMVYRRLNFVHGVPDEYDWTTDDPLLKQYGGLGTQRMTVDTWLDVIDAETPHRRSHRPLRRSSTPPATTRRLRVPCLSTQLPTPRRPLHNCQDLTTGI